MSDLTKFRVITTRPLEYAERWNPEYEMALTRKKDNEDYEQMYLFQVFLKRRFKTDEGGISRRQPITSMYYVFANSEDEAIKQIKGCAFPEVDYITYEDQRNLLTATATRIPFHIRGWGHNTF